MEEADFLYGVTMQEKGVSKAVSYTHLDVYKRQLQPILGLLFSAQKLHLTCIKPL